MLRAIMSILLVVFIASPFALLAQIKEPVQIDEFGPVNSEEIEARLDNASIQLNNNSGSLLQLIFSRGEKDSFGSPYRLYGLMKTYLLYRKVDMSRVVASFCKPTAQKNGQLWLISATGPKKTCDPENIDITETMLFDSAPSATDKGTDFGCCVVDLFGPAAAAESLRAFAELLKRYPDSKAYVYSYGGTNVYWTTDSKGRERTVRNLDSAQDIANLSRKARRILTEKGVQTTRIVTKNAGYRDSVAQMELWIVPSGRRVPKLSPDYPKKRARK